MSSSRIAIAILLLLTVGIKVPLHAQAGNEKEGYDPSQIRKQKVLPQPRMVPDVPLSAHPSSLNLLPSAAMSSSDSEAVRAAWSQLEQSAAIEGFDLSENHWTYQQISCPAFPHHILLEFTEGTGTRDLSMFSAVVPRNGSEPARILPILRRGISTYSGSAASPIAITTFNRLRPQILAPDVDWLTLGMCYAALRGVHVVLPNAETEQADGLAGVDTAPLVQISANGAMVIQFSDIESLQEPKRWEMSYDSKGKLLTTSVTQIHPPAMKVIPAPR